MTMTATTKSTTITKMTAEETKREDGTKQFPNGLKTSHKRSENDPKTPGLRGRNIDVGVFGLRTVRKLPTFVQAFFCGSCRYPFPLGEHGNSEVARSGARFRRGPPQETCGGGAGAQPPPRRWRRSAI